MKLIITYVVLLFSYSTIYAQIAIQGKVLSKEGAVSFASVGVEGTDIGTSSKENGEFEFAVKDLPVQLVVSAIGYERKKITVSANDGYLSILLNPIENALDEVVISGTLKEMSRSESPVVVDIITPKLFKKNPTPSLFNALEMVNGVQPQINCSVCNTGDIHINGMEGPYTMITIDGMPIVSGLSTVYGLSGIPNSLVDRIEVVKGPSSTLYGSEAVAGLINVITKSPESANRLSTDFMVSSQQEYNLDAGIKLGGEKANSLLGINYFNFQNRFDNNKDGFTDVTLQNRISVFNKWSFNRKNNRVFNVAGRFVYEDRFGGEMNWESKFRGTDSVYGESIYTTRYELIGNYQLPFDKEKMFLQFSFNDHTQDSYYGTTPYMANQKVAFTQLLWNKEFGLSHDLSVGMPFRYTYYDDNSFATNSINGTDTVNSPDNVFLPGLFIQDQITISDKLTSLAGIRYDHNSRHGNIFSPRLNFKYSFNKNNVLRLGGGNGYRVVNLFTEDHAALTGAREVVVLNDLKPERSVNINASHQYKHFFKSGFMILDMGMFYTHFSNKIIPDYETDPDKIIYDNLNGHSVSQGINLNVNMNFSNSLKLIAGATYMDVYIVESDSDGATSRRPQLFAPKFSANYSLTYTIKKWKLDIDYTGVIKGPMFLPVVPGDFRPETSPWYSIQNIQFTKQFKRDIEVYIGIKNLLNFTPNDPILRPFDPFDKEVSTNNPNNYTFDTTYNYASMQGLRGFVGFRYVIP